MGSTFGADRRDRTLPKEVFCNRLSGFSSLACNGSRLVRARRKSNAVAGAGFEKCFDVAVGKKGLVPEEFCNEGGFCKLLDGFHSTKGGEKIGTGCDHTVIGHEDGVVVRHKSSEGFAKPGRTWCGVLSQRDIIEQHDNFWKLGFVQGTTGGCAFFTFWEQLPTRKQTLARVFSREVVFSESFRKDVFSSHHRALRPMVTFALAASLSRFAWRHRSPGLRSPPGMDSRIAE
jgi:hypothetical protein